MTDKKQELIETPAPQLPATAGQQADAMIQIIREVVMAPDANQKVDALRAMLDMQRQLVKDQAERAFNEGMAAMASEMPRIKKSGKVEYLVDKNKKDGPKEEAFKFARYEDIDAAVRPIMVKHGFSISYSTKPRTSEGGGLVVVGTLSHVQGHFRESEIAVALDNSGGKNNIQGMGSSSSYGKRYVLCNLLNIITEGQDDDGNAAEFITTEQAVEIDLKIVESGADKARFLKWIKAADVQSIPMTKYGKAIAELDRKAKEKAAAPKGKA